jgi:hypothetical protein
MILTTKMESDNLDQIQKLAVSIKETIETSSYDKCRNILDELYDKWIMRGNASFNLFDYLDTAISNFNLNKDTIQIGLFERAKKTVIYQLTALRIKFEKTNLNFDDKNLYEEKFTKLFRAVIDADNAISSSLFLKSSMTLEDIGSEKKTKHDLFRYTEVDYGKLNPYQTLLIYLLDQIQRKEYKRYMVGDKAMCYEKIYNDKGYNTHAWKKAMSVKEFIQDATKKEYNFAMWQNLTHAKDNLKACVEYLSSCPGPEFEDLVKQRNVYSFKNGIYITKKWDTEYETWKDQWIPFEGKGSIKIGESIVGCKLFDIDFDDCSSIENWFDIIKTKCPHFMSLMNDQRWPEEVQKWMCILIGRLMYEVGELDNWQVMPYLLGMAGTGKSTILENIIKLLYDIEDIGVLSNNMEKKFGVGPLADKKIFIGPEIKGNLSLEQAEFQSMISGESMQVAKKYFEARTIKFTAPGICAGNETPNFTDNAGSMARRIIVFLFGNKIKKGDTKLGHKIQKEIAYIIQACNRGYLATIEEHGKSGIWEILPEYFKETQESMAENTNGLTHFLKSSLVTFGKEGKDEKGVELYCREKVFVAAFNDHCRESHFASTKWTSQFYSGPFADFNIRVVKNSNKRYPNKPGAETFSGIFLMGVDVKDPVIKSETE